MADRAVHIRLSKGVAQAIREVNAAAAGHEACGFLLGRQGETAIDVEAVRPATNIYGDEESFAISHREYVEVSKDCDATVRIVGIYHTHPGNAHLSHQDRRSIARSPFVWLIVGKVSEGLAEWRVFKHDKGKVRELRMSIEE